MAEGVSIREFARRAGCDDKVVRRKLESSHLPRNADGTINPEYLDVDWRKGEPLPAGKAGGIADNADNPSDDPQDADSEGLWSKAEAERRKENYAARLKELQFARESGLVVDIDDVVVAVAHEYAIVRNKLLDVGTKVAPRVRGLQSAEEIKAIIDARINEALKELALDVDGERDYGKLRQSIQKRFSETSDSLEESPD